MHVSHSYITSDVVFIQQLISDQYKVPTENARLEQRDCKLLSINVNLELQTAWSPCQPELGRASVERHHVHGVAVLSLAVTSRLNRMLHLALEYAISLHL